MLQRLELQYDEQLPDFAFNVNLRSCTLQLLKLKYDEPLPNFAFNFNLRRCTPVLEHVGTHVAALHGSEGAAAICRVTGPGVHAIPAMGLLHADGKHPGRAAQTMLAHFYRQCLVILIRGASWFSRRHPAHLKTVVA